MARLVFVTYAGIPPVETEIENTLRLQDYDNYTYVVSTAALARDREGLAPSAQFEQGKARLVFRQVLRIPLNENLLSRAEERVILRRALKSIASDSEMEQQLKQDIFAWREALADLASRGIDLTNGIPPDLQQKLVHPKVAQVLDVLQREFRKEQQQHGKITFEQAALDYLNNVFNPPDLVVMEGFAFLTPLQERFLKICLAWDVDVRVVIPYSQDQAAGFAIMERTFTPWNFKDKIALLPTSQPANGSTLSIVQNYLFANSTMSIESADGSIVLEAYHHRNREAASCIKRIQSLLDSGIDASDIAIVLRDRASYNALLQEEAETQKLRNPDGTYVRLGVEPRLLLLTPLGRFVLTLYQIWQKRQLSLSPDQFESVLASGWLGGHVQRTQQRFSALKAQFFGGCSTKSEWETRLNSLQVKRSSLTQDSRSPITFVEPGSIEIWRIALNRIEAMCQRLFDVPNQSIRQHIEILMDELTKLSPDDMRHAERQMLERIERVFEDLRKADSLAISAEEFGEILNSLARERERSQEEDTEADVVGLNEDHIWITTPEGIDSHKVSYVFYLGVDDQHVPRKYSEPWPIWEPKTTQHIEIERYLFLSVVRAATERLYLSFSEVDDQIQQMPSPYLRRIQDIGVPLVKVGEVASEGVSLAFSTPSVRRARRNMYEIEEIAHFALCPFRYKLERLSVRAGQYRDEFQMRFLTESVWLDKIMTYARQSSLSAKGAQAIRDGLYQAMESTRLQVQDLFPGLTRLDWFAVGEAVRTQLNHIADEAGDYEFSVGPGESARYVLTEGDRVVEINVHVRHTEVRGIVSHPHLRDIQTQEWLRNGTKKPFEPELIAPDGVNVFSSLYPAVQWWRSAVWSAIVHQRKQDGRMISNADVAEQNESAFADHKDRIRQWVQAIEQGPYPKNPGDHCIYCPVRADCLGIKEENL